MHAKSFVNSSTWGVCLKENDKVHTDNVRVGNNLGYTVVKLNYRCGLIRIDSSTFV